MLAFVAFLLLFIQFLLAYSFYSTSQEDFNRMDALEMVHQNILGNVKINHLDHPDQEIIQVFSKCIS